MRATAGRYAEVLVDQTAAALDKAFTYSIPAHLASRVTVGSYVRVPLGKQHLAGYVIGLTADRPAFRLRDLEDLLLDEPVFGPTELELARYVATTYCCPLSSALRLVLPPGAARRPAQRLTLTEAGRMTAALAGESGGPPRDVLLRALLAAGGEAGREELARALDPGARLPALLRELERAGLVAIRRTLRPPSAAARSQLWARLLVAPEAALDLAAELQRPAPRQAETLRRLAEEGPLPLAALPRPAAQALAAAGRVELYEEAVQRRPQGQTLEQEDTPWTLTPAQAAALERVEAALEAHTYWGGLLHGVTGSGKTEVYLRALARALARGRTAIVLVPEISLTPQTVGRFAARFGETVAVLHSSLSAGERYDEWQRVARGEARVVIGARSALFAPCRDLGLIVVDEEHEPSYKQDSSPRYHAVAVARKRAELCGAVLLLGSATPALEDYYAAVNPEDPGLELLELPSRIGDRPLPEVRTLDLRGETLLGPGETFAEEMRAQIENSLSRGEQVMLFLNRRGFSTFVICRECGHVLRCPDCAVSLIYHHRSQLLRCHHCDYARPAPEECEHCHGVDLNFTGLGTERLADQVQRLFPHVTALRLDRDSVHTRDSYARILGQFARGEAQILVGTQMIAKGHDFPAVTMVGVINADTGLHRPDFRAAERTFQILTQVSGRAGRADKPGVVYVQTYNPDHYALRAAAAHDYRAFYQQEIRHRRETYLPPFSRLAHLVFSHTEEAAALEGSRAVAAWLQEQGWLDKQGARQFVGPSPAPLFRLRGRYRYHLLLKAPDEQTLGEIVCRLQGALRLPPDLLLTVDVDPCDMM